MECTIGIVLAISLESKIVSIWKSIMDFVSETEQHEFSTVRQNSLVSISPINDKLAVC